jgi:hypothetical protein
MLDIHALETNPNYPTLTLEEMIRSTDPIEADLELQRFSLHSKLNIAITNLKTTLANSETKLADYYSFTADLLFTNANAINTCYKAVFEENCEPDLPVSDLEIGKFSYRQRELKTLRLNISQLKSNYYLYNRIWIEETSSLIENIERLITRLAPQESQAIALDTQ